ncbi:hypothetical protein AYL99_11850 [Fonsecaea erecta]|uniref:Uncharacterized protein n=1 Tax=Fonsecaea erecta TaxID=1367422 RepID=A0A178Z2H7_9EURO|nr:hypothetical protein AYL99_11850 [Fonsecaea erecta]OAP53970.1 hypothetical protein AYL99_11850 [Fonsecaea erecta]
MASALQRLNKPTDPISADSAKKNNIPDTSHVLLPRSTGIEFCPEELEDTVESLYDCTIAYEEVSRGQYAQDIFTLKAGYSEGQTPKPVSTRWRPSTVDETPPHNVTAFELWLRARWGENDVMTEALVEKTPVKLEPGPGKRPPATQDASKTTTHGQKTAAVGAAATSHPAQNASTGVSISAATKKPATLTTATHTSKKPAPLAPAKSATPASNQSRHKHHIESSSYQAAVIVVLDHLQDCKPGVLANPAPTQKSEITTKAANAAAAVLPWNKTNTPTAPRRHWRSLAHRTDQAQIPRNPHTCPHPPPPPRRTGGDEGKDKQTDDDEQRHWAVEVEDLRRGFKEMNSLSAHICEKMNSPGLCNSGSVAAVLSPASSHAIRSLLSGTHRVC